MLYDVVTDRHSQGEILAPLKPAEFFAVVFPGAGTCPVSQRWGERSRQSCSQHRDEPVPAAPLAAPPCPVLGEAQARGSPPERDRQPPSPSLHHCLALQQLITL